MTEIKPVSEKQLKWLRQFKVPEDIIASLNSKSASDILSAKFGDDDKDEDKAPEVVKPGRDPAPGFDEPKQNNILHIKNPYEKDPVGLAVEIFVAMYEKDFNKEDLMNMSINLVKQAREAFA